MDEILKKAKTAQKSLELIGNEKREECLKRIVAAIYNNEEYLLEQNEIDLKLGQESGLSQAMLERLTLTHERLESIASGIIEVSKLPNYLNEVIEEIKRPNGLLIKKIRVPFGVIAVIFESRPNVLFDIAALTIKTGNSCVLKGGKEAINTNRAIAKVIRDAIKDIVDPNCVTFIDSVLRSTTDELITKKEYIDLLIPRGSKRLINYITSNAKVPFIETGAGNCHLYVHEKAKLPMAIKIAINAKYQRPSVCNAIESIVVDEKIAPSFLPLLADEFKKLNIELRGCKKTLEYIKVNEATAADFYTEYNDYIVSIKVVKDINEAISFINEHSTKHSEAIITEDLKARDLFMTLIDSACVYHNASTRFTDGNQFGLGAEIGISTSKLHARGPMGLKEITTYKYVIYGNGEIRK